MTFRTANDDIHMSDIMPVVSHGAFSDRLSFVITDVWRMWAMFLFRLFWSCSAFDNKPNPCSQNKNSDDQSYQWSNFHALNLGVWSNDFKRGVASC